MSSSDPASHLNPSATASSQVSSSSAPPHNLPSASEPTTTTATSGDAPLSERKLSDLTDLEIASLTQEIKSESANQRPLIGVVEPLSKLSDEYESTAVKHKIEWLGQNGWTGLRRSRGDGDCFYRSFAFSYLERLVSRPPSAAQLSQAKLESLMPLLDQAGFAKDIYDDFYEPLRDLLVALGPEANPSDRPTSTTLYDSFNSAETSNAIVVFLRLLTSAFLRANEDDFTPFLFSLDDDPRFFETGGAPTMDQFCGFHVEAVNKEADHIQITALTRALGVGLRIAYLDQSPIAGGRVGEVEFVEFEQDKEEQLEGCLLYTVNHYDVLYR